MRRDPVHEWREQYARHGTRVGFEPAPHARFRASVQEISGDPQIVKTRLSPGATFRDEAMLRDGDDRLSLVISHAPRLHVWHRGRELSLDRGDATLLQADATGRMASGKSLAFIEVSIQPAAWSARGVRSGDFLMRHLRRESEGVRLLSSYIASLASFGRSTSAETREVIRRHVVDLAVLAATRASSVGESDTSAVMAARRASVLDHIGRRFQDPELSVLSAANALRISPRYLQRLLETLDMSFTAHVTELRLQQALKLLTEGGRGRHRIADVAFEAGFSDVSYFNRLFRSRFGDTPRGVRSQVQQKTHTYT
jgi:AraC-like DNA-binding protein